MTKKINSNKYSIKERERERLVVWALFDDAESSYKNAIAQHFKNHNLEVHSVGINDISFAKSDKYFYHLIDLSLNNFNLIDQLSCLPKPDIILASPPCESWSCADCNGKMVRKIDRDGNWFVQNSQFYEKYNKDCHPVKRRYFIQKEQSRIIGESTIGASIYIIKHFKPKVWVIENPQTSLTWKFQEYHWDFKGYMNKVYYSSYDKNFSLKPTIFKSNVRLNFKEEKIKGNNNHMAYGSYSKRSSIPSLLIKDMIDSILNSKEMNN